MEPMHRSEPAFASHSNMRYAVATYVVQDETSGPSAIPRGTRLGRNA